MDYQHFEQRAGDIARKRVAIGLAAAIAVWTAVDLVRTLRQPGIETANHKIVEKVEGTSLQLLDLMASQRRRGEGPFDAQSAMARLSAVHGFYAGADERLSAAARTDQDTARAVAQANNWMKRVDGARERVAKAKSDDERRMIEAEWRTEASQAVIELREAAAALRGAGSRSGSDRGSRIVSLLGVLFLSGAVAGLLLLVHADAPARTRQSSTGSEASSSSVMALHMVQDAVFTLDANLCIVGLNPAAERLFGYRLADVLGRPISSMAPALTAPSSGTSRAEAVYCEGKDKQGKPLSLEATLRVVKRGPATFGVAVLRPVKAIDSELAA